MNIVTDADRLKVREYFKQALQVSRQVEELKAELKDIFGVLKDQHDINPSVARKVLKAMDDGNMPELRQTAEAIEDLYDIVQGGAGTISAQAQPFTTEAA